MSPTIHREKAYRFYFNSSEEPRMHVHIEGQNGKAKSFGWNRSLRWQIITS